MPRAVVTGVEPVEHWPGQAGAGSAGDLPAVEVATEELQLARTLIDASTRTAFDLARYPDAYTDQLRRLIEAKAAGKEIVAPPPETPQPMIFSSHASVKPVPVTWRIFLLILPGHVLPSGAVAATVEGTWAGARGGGGLRSGSLRSPPLRPPRPREASVP